jgi:hypothetical protein
MSTPVIKTKDLLKSLEQAGETIAAKDREIASLLEALKPFADEADLWSDRAPDDLAVSVHSMDAEHLGEPSQFTVGDLRRARAARAEMGKT